MADQTEQAVMTSTAAMHLAYDAHVGQTDYDDRPHFDHVRRVAHMVPEGCRRVAWLHDVVEDTTIPLERLRELGLHYVELLTVELLTRAPTVPYHDYVRAIACADGESGQVARCVKEADLIDNLSRCLRAPDTDDRARTLAVRYRRALPVIQRAIIERDGR